MSCLLPDFFTKPISTSYEYVQGFFNPLANVSIGSPHHCGPEMIQKKTGAKPEQVDVGDYVAHLGPYQVARLKVSGESVGMQNARKYFYGPTLPGNEAYHILDRYQSECKAVSKEWMRLQEETEDKRYIQNALLMKKFEQINAAYEKSLAELVFENKPQVAFVMGVTTFTVNLIHVLNTITQEKPS